MGILMRLLTLVFYTCHSAKILPQLIENPALLASKHHLDTAISLELFVSKRAVIETDISPLILTSFMEEIPS
jgi:hypothetical protein